LADAPVPHAKDGVGKEAVEEGAALEINRCHGPKAALGLGKEHCQPGPSAHLHTMKKRRQRQGTMRSGGDKLKGGYDCKHLGVERSRKKCRLRYES
jgi:hypothetical protein